MLSVTCINFYVALKITQLEQMTFEGNSSYFIFYYIINIVQDCLQETMLISGGTIIFF